MFDFSRDGLGNVMLREGIPKHQEKHMSRNDFVFFEQLVIELLLGVNRP